MAAYVMTDAFLKIGSTTFSNTKQLELKVTFAEQETTAFQASSPAYTSSIAGLGSWEANAELYLDSTNESALWALLGTTSAVEVRASSAAVSATNPKWTGNATLFELSPVNGSVGDVPMVKITLKGSGAITRATA
jgi:hypothetical protein